MKKDSIEIEAKQNVDVCGLAKFLAATTGVEKAYVITGQNVHIYCDEDKLQTKKLLKVIASFGSKERRGWKANVVTLKQIKQSA